MAWLGRFEDFDKFEEDFAGKTNCKQFQTRIGQCQQSLQNGPSQNIAELPEARKLCDITPHANNITVTLTGVIIAKEQQRSVISRKNNGSERHLLSFTLRDSPSCFVNVTCWGSAGFINSISNKFEVGSVVRIKNAQIQQKAVNLKDEKFKPWTPVSFQVSVSENHGSYIEAYSGWDAATYKKILFLPTRPSNDYYTLEDISINGMALHGEHVNILAAVKRVGQVRYFTTKSAKQTKKCDVILFDDTCSSFSLELWQDHAEKALLWIPFQTVLFVADIKTAYSNFKSSMIATADCKTIFTVDPDTQESHCLRQFLKSQSSSGCDPEFGFPENDMDPDINSITEMFTVQQLKEKRISMAQEVAATTYYGLLNVMLTTFDVDTDSTDGVLRKICGQCRKLVDNSTYAVCTNPTCSTNCRRDMTTSTSSEIITEYSISVSFSDYTGTVSYCRLQPTVAETLLGCQPQAFLYLTGDQKTHLKWQHLLEEFKVIFKLKKFKYGTDYLPAIQILSMKRYFCAQKPCQQQD